jgi:hypothetical protein
MTAALGPFVTEPEIANDSQLRIHVYITSADRGGDRDVITEADVVDPVTETEWCSEQELEEQRADWEYWEDVRSCCGGQVWGCIHWGCYTPPRQWLEP